MGKKLKIRSFIKNEDAISEEFTSLPALTIVAIGFTLFILLVANTYSAYNARVESLDKYQTTDFIVKKITNPDSPITTEGGIIDLKKLKDTSIGDPLINAMRSEYQASGIDFIVRITYENTELNYPTTPTPAADLLQNNIDKIAVSKNVGIKINDAETKPGKLTIISWSV